jgi:hypothetical protein
MRALAALLAAALATVAAGGDDGIPVSIEVGSAKNLCSAGLVGCPAATFMCDDPKVAVIENAPDGAVLRGISAGTTLCAVGSVVGFRRILRVTVLGPKPAGGAPAR